MSRHRFVIVGAGVISRRHAELIAAEEDAELVAVVDRDEDRATAWAAERGIRPFTDLATALDATGADVVVVCTPTSLHGDVAIEALRAGRHVVIEKPADISTQRIDDIIAAQREAGTLVTVISQHRFDPSTEHVVEAVRAGGLGRLTSGIATIDLWRGQSYYDSGDWRGTWQFDGGGALMNQGVHTVDLLLAIMGPAAKVTGYAATLAHERLETEDVAVGIVRFASGALGAIHGSTAVFPGLDTRVQIHGDRGSAVIVNDQLTFFHSTPAGTERAEVLMGKQGKSENHLDTAPVPAGDLDPMAYQYRNFLAALGGEEPVRVGLQENREAVALITGLYESARTGAPVALAATR
jgi:UDP-N-acetyl-2-amino-2-deoxyglucuronate dehydrogenase